MHERIVESRRRFLKQASLGTAGLTLTGNYFRIFGSGQPALAQANQTDEAFAPIRYQPMAATVTGLTNNAMSLNGEWRIDPQPAENVRDHPLDAASWSSFQVPGQWAQQGFDLPQDRTVALAREFSIPEDWAGYRMYLRFDAIHGGTHYWLNGKPLGYSENLFTPVEWEITDAAKSGQANRLDLEIKVATLSEKLSNASGYVGYSLGGVDRAVRVYALPRLHVSSLRLNVGLDKAYHDGDLRIVLGLDNPEPTAGNGFIVSIRLFDASGKAVEHSNPKVVLEPLQPGLSTVSIESRVANPLQVECRATQPLSARAGSGKRRPAAGTNRAADRIPHRRNQGAAALRQRRAGQAGGRMPARN